MNGGGDVVQRSSYVELVPIKLTRLTTPRGDVLRLTGDDYAVEVTINVQGLELDAATLEKVLHAPLTMLAERIRETI